jgi:hypothetical protein
MRLAGWKGRVNPEAADGCAANQRFPFHVRGRALWVICESISVNGLVVVTEEQRAAWLPVCVCNLSPCHSVELSRVYAHAFGVDRQGRRWGHPGQQVACACAFWQRGMVSCREAESGLGRYRILERRAWRGYGVSSEAHVEKAGKWSEAQGSKKRKESLGWSGEGQGAGTNGGVVRGRNTGRNIGSSQSESGRQPFFARATVGQ